MQTDERDATASFILLLDALLVTQQSFHLFSTEVAPILHTRSLLSQYKQDLRC